MQTNYNMHQVTYNSRHICSNSTHRVRWLKPTVLKVNALANRRTCVNRTPMDSSKLVSFCRTGDVSISCLSV